MNKTVSDIYKIAFIFCLIFALSFTQPNAVSAQKVGKAARKESGQKLKQQLQAKLDEWHKQANFSGAMVGVVLADGESFALATGHADRGLKRAMKTWQLGSVLSLKHLTRSLTVAFLP